MFKLTKGQNLFLKHLIVLSGILFGGGIVMGFVIYRSSYFSSEGHFVSQPIAFSHRLHVHELGLECQFCHVHSESKSSMEIPTSETCYGCHREILKTSDYLEPVRSAYKNKTAVIWNRANNLADHVYFHHGKHIEAGITCIQCHGDVELMPLISPIKMTMKWCLSCHENFTSENKEISSSKHLQMKDCYTCHR